MLQKICKSLEEELLTFHIGEFIEPCEKLLLLKETKPYQNWTMGFFCRARFLRYMHWTTFTTFRNHLISNKMVMHVKIRYCIVNFQETV